MPNSYRPVDPDEPLSQGDIFDGIPIADLSYDPFYEMILDTGCCRAFKAGELVSNMVVASIISLTPAIVLSQSCDAALSPRIMLAPLVPFLPEGGTSDKKWGSVRKVATDIVGALYLPDDPGFEFPKRLALLDAAFTTPRAALRMFARQGKRKATLQPNMLSHLQYRLGVMYSRQAREETEWASVEDLGFLIASLDKRITAKQGKITGARRKLERLGVVTGDSYKELVATIKTDEEDLEDLKDQRKLAERALAEAQCAAATRGGRPSTPPPLSPCQPHVIPAPHIAGCAGDEGNAPPFEAGGSGVGDTPAAKGE